MGRNAKRRREQKQASQPGPGRAGLSMQPVRRGEFADVAEFFASGDDWPDGTPPDELFDTSGCPVGDRCVGCGATADLGQIVSVFGAAEVACATVCRGCDGRSLLTMVGFAGLRERVAEHARHAARTA